MKSTSGSALAVMRSHRTPVASWSASRCSAVTTPRREPSRSAANRSSSDMPSPGTIAPSVAPDGPPRPARAAAGGELGERAGGDVEAPRELAQRDAAALALGAQTTRDVVVDDAQRAAPGPFSHPLILVGPLYSASERSEGERVAEGSVVV